MISIGKVKECQQRIKKTYCFSLDLQSLQRSVDIILQPLELDLVKLQPRKNAPMQLINRLPMRNLLIAQKVLLPIQPGNLEALHAQLHLPDQHKVRLGPLPHDVAVALDQVAVQPVDGQDPVLEILLFGVDLVAHADCVLQAAQPVAGVALLLVVGGREVVGEDDGGEEHRVANLTVAPAQVFERLDNVGAGRALDEARGDAGSEGVGQDHFPAAGFALFAHI